MIEYSLFAYLHVKMILITHVNGISYFFRNFGDVTIDHLEVTRSRDNLFQKMKVLQQHADMKEEMGKYPVVHLSFDVLFHLHALMF